MLTDLRAYLDRHGIGAMNFACRHAASCRSAGGTFTTAKESFVGPDYEKGTLPRLLFLSLDSGSAEADPSVKTLEAVRACEMAVDVLALPRGKHWYETHELAWVLLQQFRPGLKLADIGSYLAHVNSAKCCMNNAQRRQAADILFDNCREFIPGELLILQPDIIISQGGQARRVMKHFQLVQRERVHGLECEVAIVRCGSKNALWIPTHHPSAYGLYWAQKKACWREYAEAVGAFIENGKLQQAHAGNRSAPTPVIRKPSGIETKRNAAPSPPSAFFSLDDMLEAVRAVRCADSFNQFIRMWRRTGPDHPHIGITSGMRVQAFQNWLLDQNPKWHLTDAQLLAVMRVEFPLATGEVFTGTLEAGLRIVKGIRAHYNRDGHNGPSPQSRGMPLSTSYGTF